MPFDLLHYFSTAKISVVLGWNVCESICGNHIFFCCCFISGSPICYDFGILLECVYKNWPSLLMFCSRNFVLLDLKQSYLLTQMDVFYCCLSIWNIWSFLASLTSCRTSFCRWRMIWLSPLSCFFYMSVLVVILSSAVYSLALAAGHVFGVNFGVWFPFLGFTFVLRGLWLSHWMLSFFCVQNFRG